MKKFLCMLLCLLMACIMLVSCDDGKIGEYIKNYPETDGEVEKLTLNLYIIVGDGTSASAKESVARELNVHTLSKLNTELKVYYVDADDYEQTVKDAIAAGGANVPHVILINSNSMMQDLVKGSSVSKLADLTGYVDGSIYGSLNTQIPKALMQGSRIDGKYYSVPNNHLIDEYDYLVIDKAVANHYLYNDTKLASYKTLEDAAALIADMQNDGMSENDINSAVFTKSGNYELKAEYEKNGYICNVSKYPTVTADEAFESAFAVVNHLEVKYNERAMQLIFEINTNVYFRNLLQYGVQGTHYTLEDGVVTVLKDDPDDIYNMNLLYTGDIFKAYYCDELGWSKDDYNNVFNQNEESVVAK